MGTQKTYTVGNLTLTPKTLSSMVLEKLKKDIESQIGEIDQVVVTIPANFANEAREDTLQAAKIAGLQIEHIINEPTAAALYYAKMNALQLNGYYAIYDMGGGTFDISVIYAEGEKIEVVSTEGVSHLGGDDFDESLRNVIGEKYKTQTGSELLPDDFTKLQAEDEKKSLSRRENVVVRVNSEGGRANISVSREEYEQAISSLIAQAEMLCESALDSAKIDSSHISDVILVGGSTRTPAIKKSIERVFKKTPSSFANPDEVVALGAAVYAAIKANPDVLNKAQKNSISKVSLDEISSKYFGTLSLSQNNFSGQQELENNVIIPKGMRIPAKVSESFYTVVDNQRNVQCTVTESNTDEKDPRFVRIIFDGRLEVPAGRPRGQEVRVEFSYDINQIMHCSFTDVETGRIIEIDLNLTDGKSINSNNSKFLIE
jgi:molecular chaperone DnaK